MPKKGTFFRKKWSTNTSLEAFTIIEVEGNSLTLFKIFIIGKFIGFGLLKVKDLIFFFII